MTLRRNPNDRLRAARLRMKSPSGSGLPMSRRELADLVNAHLAERAINWLCMDSNNLGKYERGEHIWPQREYREALRTVLGVRSDADLGFYTRRAVDVASTVPRPQSRSGWSAVTVAALTTRADAVTYQVAASVPSEVAGA